ncbi:alpha-ketoglutarate-dependent dioxygenase AlkB family protein [Empedobacter falsenii]|uniref:alpha-ketoglutarate-dependent dioxygenase AlkB family protein n=1 Tax=Empedobacter TaxID=59734 RepID=UPI001C8D3466|nr:MULTISPECIES: alpha-ketoglutarate-dependent dioxygenase AlkB [Empedobacter]MBY0066662.1 alpha-ketoglutarate-dependent dioxygenase AlkB [Empedobacter falsenii]MDH1884171.1 alpha-ketoglutarate-dependent dioxygenase AlkB [Empedobacter sp. GD03797]
MDQLDLFAEPKNPYEPIQIMNGSYIYIDNFFNRIEADFFLNDFINNIVWEQQSMNMYGKIIPFPRLTTWYGDNDKPYTFSGITLQPHPWNESLLKIKSRIEPLSGVNFNSVLLNRYRDGNDSISWHTDAEKELGNNPVIASVNFGEERVFQLKHKDTGERIDIPLKHGSLLIMMGELQHFWKHQVPKSKKTMKERVNLTFRVIK